MKKTDIHNEPSPEKIMETTFAYAATRVLVAGVDLEVFTHIANGNHTAADIAKAADASQRGIEILLNSLASLNFITKSDGTYDLNAISEKFLVKVTPAYYGDFVKQISVIGRCALYKKLLGNRIQIIRTIGFCDEVQRC